MRSGRTRRSYNRTRTALGTSNLSLLKGAINKLYRRMEKCNVPPGITPHQVVAMVANEEDREVLLKASELIETNKYWREDSVTIQLNNYTLTLDVSDCAFNPFLPKSPVLQPDIAPQIVEDLIAYGEQRADIRWAFGKLERALEALDYICSNAVQVRYLWPSITALARVAELKELTERLATCSVPSKVPGLHPALKEALKEGAGLIAAACLLEDPNDTDVKEWRSKYAQVEALQVGAPSYRDDGFGSYGPK